MSVNYFEDGKLSTYKSRHNESHNEKGNVLVEMAVVFPLCLFFLLGILELGRILAQYSWVQQTTYNAAFLGSGLSTTDVALAPSSTASTLFSFLNSTKSALSVLPVVTTTYNDPDFTPGVNDTVSVNIQTNLNMLSQFYPSSLNTTTTAPSVVIGYSFTDLNEFENGLTNQYYDCGGSLCSPASTACALAPCH